MMASNPMQRKIRNSVLLGVLGTLIATGAIIVLLLGMLKQKNDELQAINDSKRNVYVLTQNVKKGQVLTESMFEKKSIQNDSIPDNATLVKDEIQSWFLQTKQGEKIHSNRYGDLYLDRTSSDLAADTIIEVEQNAGREVEDFDGSKISSGDYYYIDINENVHRVKTADVLQDEYGSFIIEQEKDKQTRVYKEDLTGEFYVFKIDTASMNSDGPKVRIKEYIDIKNVPVIAKVDMNVNTVITKELVVQSTEVVTDDTRQEEYNVVVLPSDLMTNDYIDIRLMTPNGQNFIVVSKAQVEVPVDATGKTYFADTIRVNLREDEILAMSSAIVEAAGIPGAKLYAVRYVEPAMQEESYTTYVPNAAVTAQLDPEINGKYTNFKNPNILETAKKELLERYSNAAIKVRNEYLNSLINDNAETYQENVQAGMDESTGTSITTRQKYLESLNY